MQHIFLLQEESKLKKILLKGGVPHEPTHNITRQEAVGDHLSRFHQMFTNNFLSRSRVLA
jgi:hypothetical protein